MIGTGTPVLGGLSSLPIGQIGAGTLVALIVLLILTGRLVPRQQVKDLRADRDKLMKANDDLLQAHHEFGMALEKLLSLAETTNHALTEIQQAPRRRADEDSCS